MRHFRRLLLATAAFAALSGPAFADGSEPLGVPGGVVQGMPPVPAGLPQYTPPPAVQALLAQGINLTFLGGDGGMLGYLGRFPSVKQEGGKPVKYDYQVFYVTPDGNSYLAGMMFDKTGANITDAQVNSAKNRYAVLAAAKEAQAQRTSDTPMQQPPAADAPSVQAMTESPVVPPESPAASMPKVPDPAVVDATPVVPTPQQMASTAGVASDGLHLPGSVQPLITHDAFMAAAESKSVWFTVGAKGAPEIYMIADPSCGFCHAAWAAMKPLVEARKLVVHVIPVAILPGSDQKVISILATPKPSTPGTTWLTGYGSTDMAVRPPPPVTSTAYSTADSYLKTNMDFLKVLNIHPAPQYIRTPFIAYMGKHGWRAAEGPDDVLAFLDDLPASSVAMASKP